jgi:hypothetical protein
MGGTRCPPLEPSLLEDDMAERKEDVGKLGFLDSMGKLFRVSAKVGDTAPSQTADPFAEFGAEFEEAIRGVQKIAEQHARPAQSGSVRHHAQAEDPAVERARRVKAIQKAIREDIEKMHARLATGLDPAELDAIHTFLVELAVTAAAGKESNELLPRLRHAIAARLREESGELAVTRIIALLEAAKLAWPDPTHYRATVSPEEIERSRRRRLAEVREHFLVQDLTRISERMWGIVRTWGSDYPARGAPLWEECVLEGVAAGIRGGLIRDFVEVLRRDREQLLARAESSVGKQLAALQGAVKGGVHSIEDANKVVASSLQALDQIIAQIAWDQVKATLPQARGELAS